MSKDISKEWDYRVVRSNKEDGTSADWHSIQEIYYDDETGKPMAQSIDLQIEGDTITGMRTQLERMINCLGQPVLDEIKTTPDTETSPNTIGSHEELEDYYTGPDGHYEKNQKYIYESPDGGETIFRRKIGETEREVKDITDDGVEQWKKDVLKRGGI